MLQELKVDYSAADLQDFPAGVINDGMFVEVKTHATAVGGVLSAVEVEYEQRGIDRGGDKEHAKRTLEGLVTAISSATQFMVNSQAVLLTDTSEFESGACEDIRFNSKIKVKGERGQFRNARCSRGKATAAR